MIKDGPSDGGPAFPCNWKDFSSTGQQVVREQFFGMTLRDWFAGMAMQHLVSADCPMASVAETAYQMADSMIEARRTK